MFSLVQSLEWQLGEKQTEVSALKEQVQIVEDRQHLEVTSLQSDLQVGTIQAHALGFLVLTQLYSLKYLGHL